jgi:hypothetical protein
MTHTRFTHTLGVFTLVAHLCPTDSGLRLIALLHDVGHIPFSHSVERALGLDALAGEMGYQGLRSSWGCAGAGAGLWVSLRAGRDFAGEALGGLGAVG